MQICRIFILLLIIAVTITSCHSPSAKKQKLPCSVAQESSQTIGLNYKKWEDLINKDFTKNTPKLSIKARFATVEPGFLDQHGFGLTNDRRIINEKESAKLISLIKKTKNSPLLTSPRDTAVSSGQSAFTVIETKMPFIGDYNSNPLLPSSPEMESILEPIVSYVNTGTFLGCQPKINEGAIIFDRLDLQAVSLLGIRNCEVKNYVTGEEPIIIHYSLVDQDIPFQINEGETLLLRLSARVKQYTSNIRAHFPPAQIKESFTSYNDNNTFIAGNECIVLVKAIRTKQDNKIK